MKITIDIPDGMRCVDDRMADAAYAAIMAIKLAIHVLGCSIEDISKMDLDKYRPRYPGGFAPERSMHREES